MMDALPDACEVEEPTSADDICVLQGDGGWDLLAALNYLRGQAGQGQDQHSLTAVDFLERRLRKVSMRNSC